MILKYRIAFKLRPYGKAKVKYQIQLHATFNAQRIIISTGCQIGTEKAWNADAQVVVSGYKGEKGETASTINSTLHNCREQMELTFKFFEANDIIPTKVQVIEKYTQRIMGITPIKQKEEPKQKHATENKFFDVFLKFVTECGEKNAWTMATFAKMAALKEDLVIFKNDIKFSDLDEACLASFVAYLRDDKVLKTPRKKKEEGLVLDASDTTGLKNSTISKKLGYLRWFLNWATLNGFNTNMAYKTFKPTLKNTQKKVIYLNKQELEKITILEIPEGMSHLEPVRDVFLFCCFSGLRHSDVYNLRRTDVKGDHIEVTTVKTADSVFVDLNSVTRGILSKYKDFDFDGNKALPVIKNQCMNRDLKILCKLAGINEEIRLTTYKGSQRIDEIKKKWELIGTHTGRRTFIVNCLSLGIAPNVVMKWTGHSDYQSMKPYIDIVDTIKAREMTKLDKLLKII